MQPRIENEPLRFSRRRFLAYLGASGATGVVAGSAAVLGISSRTPDSPAAVTTTPPKESPDRLLNQILAETPFTNQRDALEHQYIAEVLREPTLAGIDRGFWVISKPSLRARLLDERWKLRNEKRDGLTPLPADKLTWIKAQNIHPEILGICLDAYPKALIIIGELMRKGKIRKDQIPAEDSMINPGGMAELIDYETGDLHHFSRYAFTNIGEGLAIEQINTGPKAFPKGISDLRTMSQQLTKDTGFNFEPDKIVGSVWPEKAIILEKFKHLSPEEIKEKLDELRSSGAAVGPQIIPENVVLLHDMTEANTDKKIKLNVFDPTDAVIMAWIFLALKGYWRNHEEDIKDALWRWNQKPEQVETVYGTAVKYYKKFIENGKYPH